MASQVLVWVTTNFKKTSPLSPSVLLMVVFVATAFHGIPTGADESGFGHEDDEPQEPSSSEAEQSGPQVID